MKTGVKEFHMMAGIGCLCKALVIGPQNMDKTSNSLSPPIKSMAARGFYSTVVKTIYQAIAKAFAHTFN